jgi:acetoin utilization deacetylase AcuC-like enzyme
MAAHGIERVAIVDFDVHHGNGTENIFSADPRVLMVSTFQHPLYPYSGFDHPAANMVNVPLAAGTGSDGFRDAVRDHWLPALDRHRPQVLYVSAGFDAHREDLAGLKPGDGLRVGDAELIAVAAKHAQDGSSRR